MRERLMHALARRAGVRVFRFFARPLGSAAQPEEGLRLLGEDEAIGLCADPELELAADKVRTAFARGDLCAAAFAENRLAGYAWFAFAPLPHLDGIWAEFAPDAAWVYKSYVRPLHRGRGIAGRLYRFGDRACRERGRRVSLICVESHNRASVKAALAAGYASAGWGAYRRGGRLLTRVSPAARRSGIRFFAPGA